jgi:DNA-binding response OmpR family regulator
MSNPAKNAIERRLAVLVVEDDLFIGLELKACLEDAGFLVLGPVGSVRDALNLITKRRPDAAVLDVNLGREKVTPVAERLNLLDVPFVIASASDPEELAQSSLRALKLAFPFRAKGRLGIGLARHRHRA